MLTFVWHHHQSVTLSSPLISLQVVPVVERDNIPRTLCMVEMCEGVGDGAEVVVEDRGEGSE